MMCDLRVGTCSWKYESWRGLVYSDTPQNYLKELARSRLPDGDSLGG